ncbi:F-box domain containing protein [Metarhizium album ARSEF 1941]|uniref:F-box domain containing protein n=1 Tax=Metarhizium album (strain ARSEF 1941) TaxID=1081103 RepID=A0A0B2WT69_METAS|nr:F-box domain containing protein [Metarhizium album ARSEF 1941]KHN96814.1 F-box domain containing protein [Metarhizium album ARSEF 1941]
MASPGNPSSWDELPDELLLQILSYLEPYHITKLQLVCHRLRKLCLDDELWKLLSFENSQWYQSLQHRRNISRPVVEPHEDASVHDPIQIDGGAGSSPTDTTYRDDCLTTCSLTSRSRKLQDMANWDPVFPGERVSWYDEYVQRHCPTCVNWLQTPRLHDRGVEATIEVRGMALYSPHGGNDGVGTMLAVSPLDDGSVCLWDINGTRGRQGGILASSNPGILFIDGPGDQNSKRSKKVDTGVTECVSVNNDGHKAFFAVQSHLIEVDLNRLEAWGGTDVFKMIFDTKPLPPYASLSQPTPISILHLPRPGSHNLVSDDIYVSGRFSNILHYDRRKFPAIVGSIYSGALIKSLAALPYPFSTVDTEVRRHGELTTEQVAQLKSDGEGRTLIAAGGYKSKGSLEIYGLSSAAGAGEKSTLQNSVTKNRQTAASSTILSVANHGSKIVFSDGSGFIKWFERDGSTECRRMKIGRSDAEEASSLFASTAGSDDMARKIVSTKSNHGNDRPNNDNILLWTGEKLGLVSFTKFPLFDGTDFEFQDPESNVENEKRREYTHRMRRALARQADEVKFIGRLGDPTYRPR